MNKYSFPGSAWERTRDSTIIKRFDAITRSQAPSGNVTRRFDAIVSPDRVWEQVKKQRTVNCQL
jgi:hypothetical protein